MRVLIFGGDGMLGHQLLRHLAPRHETRVTLHRALSEYSALGLFDEGNACGSVDVGDPGLVIRVLAEFKPEAVVNAVGIVKQRAEADDDVLSVEVNAFFPHMLAKLCRDRGARLVHISTDCVFSGDKGNYAETDRPDPVDLYGFSKLLGEADGPGALTLRTSMIGTELARKSGLLEWFLSQRGKMIKGYRKAIFSGFSTLELARVIERLLTGHPQASGLYHVSSAAISKFDLLTALNEKMRLGVKIVPDESVVCDRSLDSSRFRAEFQYVAPTWDAMLDELTAHVARGQP